MKHILLVLLASTSLAVAQSGFDTVTPDQPIQFQASATYAYARGHWVALDKNDKKSQLAGRSVSEISCDHKKGVCHDSAANVIVTGNMFALSSSVDDYDVERWNDKEIVAANSGGICRVRNVLKFDLVQKRIYSFQTLMEPVDASLPEGTKKLCEATGMSLELKAATMWRK